MAKIPVAGRVKTRLAREIGVGRATSFYRHLSLGVVARLARDPRFATLVAIAPDNTVGWPAMAQLAPMIGQGRGDIGQRMQRLLQRRGIGDVIVVGTDIPAMTGEIIANAFALLADSDAVFGPALDGGFWLAGLRRRPRVLNPFRDVRWSQANTLALARANLADKSVALATTLSDVDDCSDFHRLKDLAARRILPR